MRTFVNKVKSVPNRIEQKRTQLTNTRILGLAKAVWTHSATMRLRDVILFMLLILPKDLVYNIFP